MKNRNFITKTPINTKRLVTVLDDTFGMVGYSVERNIGDAFVYIKEHDYFVRFNFFTADYKDYATAAQYLELPVITNYLYNDYVQRLEYEQAVSNALRGAISEVQMDQLRVCLDKLDKNFAGADFDDYDQVVESIYAIKRLAVVDSVVGVGEAFIDDRSTYNPAVHYSLKVILSSRHY